MPYISPEDRKRLSLVYTKPRIVLSAGELNYIITTILDDHINSVGLRYDVINELIGVLECAKMELYRRVAVPYENKKINENGDVYSG